jgi:hypothetical protein
MTAFKRFPSYDQITRGAATSAARFPFTLLSALVGVAAAMILVGPDHSTDHPALQKLLACTALGLPLFTALTTFAERRAWSQAGRLLFQACGVALLVAYYFSLPTRINEPEYHLVRFALLNIGLHFLVAWLPWTGKNQLVGFWEYNKTLFLRFLTSALYSAVLYLGLALALAAVDQLFGADIRHERYFQLWVIIAGLFNTWVFLAGVPKNLEALNRSDGYPNGLRVFTQFILLPLVGLYVAILIAYEIKIIVTWNWPKGWVSELVLWYSVVGLLSLLLLHPLRERVESRWIQVVSKWFYRGLIPLVAMLFLAILRRISEYGVTENRYLVLGMAIGLTIVMLYMIVSRRKDIRLIPILICLLAFFSTYGPWSAFAVSRASQQNRLEELMIKNEILIDSTVHRPATQPSLDDRREMTSIVNYLSELHGMRAFAAWLPDSARQRLDTVPIYGRAEAITEKLGFTFVFPRDWSVDGNWVRLVREDQGPVDVSGYDLMFTFGALYEDSPIRSFPVGEDSCRLELDTASNTLRVRLMGPGRTDEAAMVIELGRELPALMETAEKEKFSARELTFVSIGDSASAKVVLNWINGRLVGDKLDVSGMAGIIFLRRPQ